MKRNELLYFIVAWLVVVLPGCSKDPVYVPLPKPAPREEWPTRFGFINVADTNPELYDLVFDINIYFPDKNAEGVSEHAGYYGPVGRLHDTTYLQYNFKDKVYAGCRKELGVLVLFKRGDTAYFSHKWRLPIDSIRTKADAEEFFHWPYDTLIATKIN